MGIRFCPKCNGKVSDFRNICIHCGYIFPLSKKCPDCGESISIHFIECPVCGYLFNIASSINESSTNEIQMEVIEEQNKVENTRHELVVSNENEMSGIVIEEKKSSEECDEKNHVEDIVTINHDSIITQVDNVTIDYAKIDSTDDKKQMVRECPYCENNDLMLIGINNYMCTMCRNRFIINDLSNYSPINSKNMNRESKIRDEYVGLTSNSNYYRNHSSYSKKKKEKNETRIIAIIIIILWVLLGIYIIYKLYVE